MSKPIAVLGSTSSHGGTMISASGTDFRTEMGYVCLEGDLHSCPEYYGRDDPHGVTPIVGGCTIRTIINGKPVVIEGSVAGCGAIITSGLTRRSVVT